MTLDQTAERLQRGLRRRATSPQTRPTVSSLGGIHPQCLRAAPRPRGATPRRNAAPSETTRIWARPRSRACASSSTVAARGVAAREAVPARRRRRGAARRARRSAEARACPPPPRRTRAQSRNAPRRRKPARTTRRSSPPRPSPRTSLRTAAKRTDKHTEERTSKERLSIRLFDTTVHEPRKRGSRTPPERAAPPRRARAPRLTAPPSPPSRLTRTSPPSPPPPSASSGTVKPSHSCPCPRATRTRAVTSGRTSEGTSTRTRRSPRKRRTRLSRLSIGESRELEKNRETEETTLRVAASAASLPPIERLCARCTGRTCCARWRAPRRRTPRRATRWSARARRAPRRAASRSRTTRRATASSFLCRRRIGSRVSPSGSRARSSAEPSRNPRGSRKTRSFPARTRANANEGEPTEISNPSRARRASRRWTTSSCSTTTTTTTTRRGTDRTFRRFRRTHPRMKRHGNATRPSTSLQVR